MKKGIFGSWFKELSTLIFTQTIQAFLLAIVMSIVIMAMNNGGDGTDTNYAAGMLAIIALSQFGKIELLVKNIFGVTSQYGGDMASGRGMLTAGKMAALGMGKKVLDNGKKIKEGISGGIKAKNEIRSLKTQRAEALAEAEQSDKEQENISNTTKYLGGTTMYGVRKAGQGFTDNGAGATGGATAGGLGSSAQISQLIAAVNNTTRAIQANGKSGGSGNSAKDKVKDIDQQIKEAEQKRKDSRRQLISGVAETAGAIQGAAIGATVGLGTGENVAAAAIGGAGAGDMVAGGVVRSVNTVVDAGGAIKASSSQKKKIAQKLKDDDVYNAWVKAGVETGQSAKKAAKEADHAKNYRTINKPAQIINNAIDRGGITGKGRNERAKRIVNPAEKNVNNM